MKEIVINACFGGFGISTKGMMEYARLKGIEIYLFVHLWEGKPYNPDRKDDDDELVPYDVKQHGERPCIVYYLNTPNYKMSEWGEPGNKYRINYPDRDDPYLIQMIKNIGSKAASDSNGKLKIVKIPNDVSWEINEYDGNESIEETHRSWA